MVAPLTPRGEQNQQGGGHSTVRTGSGMSIYGTVWYCIQYVKPVKIIEVLLFCCNVLRELYCHSISNSPRYRLFGVGVVSNSSLCWNASCPEPIVPVFVRGHRVFPPKQLASLVRCDDLTNVATNHSNPSGPVPVQLALFRWKWRVKIFLEANRRRISRGLWK